MEKNRFESRPDNEASSSFTLLSNSKGGRENTMAESVSKFSKLQHRLPKDSMSDVITPKKLFFQMDLFSPCRDEEMVTKSATPRQKRRASDSHTGLTPGISELLPSKVKRSRTSYDRTDKESVEQALSPIKKLVQRGDSDDEMKPSHVFANSPGSPTAQCLLDEIDVTPASDQSGEDFLKRQTSINMRRCRSLELRKRLNDMTNTPPSAFKKSLFKKPAPISETKSCASRESRLGSRSPSPVLDPPDKKQNPCPSSPPVESADHQRIKKAVDVLHNQNLVADGSRHYCLPLIQGKHTDLNNIDHETMAMVISKRYSNVFDKLTVIDCRYPYEYDGGHIKGAINIYTEDAMVEFLNKEIEESKNDSQTHILVFHCEFSSHRGPNLLRHLRNSDRQINIHQYPQLQFPEIYCLFGGYKEFYSNHPELCDPSSYTPMVDEKHASDLRHFRAKAKSWAAGDRLRLKQQQKL